LNQDFSVVHVVRQSLELVSSKDRRKIFSLTLIQVFLSALDLIGVMLIGLIGALAVGGNVSSNSSADFQGLLKGIGISDRSMKEQLIILGISSVVILLLRTLSSVIYTRSVVHFFALKGSEISSKTISRLLNEPLRRIQELTTQEIVFSTTRGIEIITINVLAPAFVLLSDLVLLIIMAVGLSLIDFATTSIIFALFGVLGYLMHKLMHLQAKYLGMQSSAINIESNEKIAEVFSSYRESIVRNRRSYYSSGIKSLRNSLAGVTGKINFMPYVSKFMFEGLVIIGMLALISTQFLNHDSTTASGRVALFMAAGTRIAPAILRVQQSFIQISSSAGMALNSLNFIGKLADKDECIPDDHRTDFLHENFLATVSVKGVTLSLPGRNNAILSDVNLEIAIGEFFAIVGPSGSGKTTLVDAILGVVKPDLGNIHVSGLTPRDAISRWPGAISYVPQDAVIINGSIRENVALGYPKELATDENVMKVLSLAYLSDFAMSLPQGLDTVVGERGTLLSGGQRQRLGIARALFTSPKLLVLDEATSSLDVETEKLVSDSLSQLKGSTTLIVIAHRLSTVAAADRIAYMHEGKILSTGTFDKVRETVSDFDRHAGFAGL
jgi:ABC-type multidrug transport system fused ATPase/permease subunit